MIYYLKNIDSLTLESTNFSLNDEEFSKIQEISSAIDNGLLLLYWQFALKTLEELDLVSNQNLSIEMFLMRLMFLNYNKSNDEMNKKISTSINKEDKIISDFNEETVNQIKNISQEKKPNPDAQNNIKAEKNIVIDTFEHLLKTCNEKKELKLKYELEKNVNLVSFKNNRIEISFNDNLDKNFVKDLSLKLFEWTKVRWIITFSKIQGEKSVKEKKISIKKLIMNKAKESQLYKVVLEKFNDAELIDIKEKNKNEDN